MDFQELLWFIFVDELIAAILLPIHETYVLDSTIIMRSKQIIFFVYGYIGSCLGIIINYFFGRFISSSFNIPTLKTNQKKNIITLYSALILIPISIFGSAVTFLCGIVKLKFTNFLLISSLINFIYFIIKFILN